MKRDALGERLCFACGWIDEQYNRPLVQILVFLVVLRVGPGLIQGDRLSALAICKLPFDVPTDPIFAARSETFENSFSDYSVPETVLRFRQR